MKTFRKLAALPFALRFMAWRLFGSSPTPQNRRVVYITEPADWVINRIGLQLKNRIRVPEIRISPSPRFLYNSLLHFGAVHAFCHGGWKRTHPSNRIILTIYHGDFGIDPEFDRTFRTVLANQDAVAHFVTSTSIMEERLAGWGVDRSKISRIPIGIDLQALKAAGSLDREELRGSLGIPPDAACIGSFQKDGSGWGEGLEPKLVKGPDLFVQAVSKLAKQRKIHCLLTGPSRGYVKKRLQEEGVPFTHRFTKSFDEIARAYRCLDLYLVSSREEGGPMALMESMGAGVPLVTTRVGMAPDIVEPGRNGYLVDIGDVEGMVSAIGTILDSPDIRRDLIRNGKVSAERFDYARIAEQYRTLYTKILGYRSESPLKGAAWQTA